MKAILIVLLVLASSAANNPLYAQPMNWKVVAWKALKVYYYSGGTPELGSIKVHNQTVLAGWLNMVLSTDFGKTWTALSPPISAPIRDIDIYDDQTFAFVTENDAYYSYDKGSTWNVITKLLSGGQTILFDGSPQKIIVGDANKYVTLFTIGGSKRSFSFPNYPSIFEIQHAADGSLCAVGYNPYSQGYLFSSTDDGLNWQISLQYSGGDDYSFIADQLDPYRYDIVNEDYYIKTDNNSDLYLTTDKGQSWLHPYSKPLGAQGALQGNSTKGCHDYFVGTKGNGILRSADKGLTWQSIGGPPTAIDSRSIAAADDSLIFAIDNTGSIWVTDVPHSVYGGAQILGDQFFRQLQIIPCDTIVTGPIYFENSGCIKYAITKVEIIGKDSSLYSAISSLSQPFLYPDSLLLRFSPSKSGKTDAHLKVTYSNGSSSIIDIGVAVSLSPLTISNSILFAHDTITECTLDSANLILSSPCALNISSFSITGADAPSFKISGKKSALLPRDSVLKLFCTPQHTGNLSATIHLIASDGRTWDVPLDLFVKLTPLEFQPSSLFSNDTIPACASDSSMLTFSTPCSLDLSSLSITGPDSASFAISGKSSLSLPTDSLIKIICFPHHSGRLSAMLHIVAGDGRTWDIPLIPFVGIAPLRFQPSVLFGSDTIVWCLSDSAVVKFSSPCPMDLASLQITGSDAASFTISGKNSASLPADSLVTIICNPQHNGQLAALLHIVGSDGRVWDIPLHLYVVESLLEFRPSSLFAGDSLEYCSAKKDSVFLSSLCRLDISSISITGVDASSFVLPGKSSATLPTDPIIVVNCIPVHSGQLSGSVHLVSTGGATWDIPLSLFIKPKPSLAFDQGSITNDFTDIIGGDISIPIVFLRTGSSGNAEFLIHYDAASLVYRGVFDASNADHTLGHPNDHSADIAFNSETDPILFARFSFYPIDSVCTHISLDSLVGEGNNSNCLNILSNSAGAEICSPAECGRMILARFQRYGTVPQLSIIPNPGSGIFALQSSEPLGSVLISITDKLGIVLATQTSELSPTKEATLRLESLQSGIYFVQVSGIRSVIPIALIK
ncbi:MAG: T9SS type A sorting domain-containing protein [Candidatus Kapaibacterium sp.]